MGQSLAQIYVHLVFGTKRRANFILPIYEERLHSYMAGIMKNLNSPALIINSVPDHVHILFRLSKNHALSGVLQELKKETSKWLKDVLEKDFSWQIGYGAFSVSQSGVAAVTEYIRNQKEHHLVASFQEEFEDFVKEYGLLDYDEEFFWT